MSRRRLDRFAVTDTNRLNKHQPSSDLFDISAAAFVLVIVMLCMSFVMGYMTKGVLG